MSDVRQQAIEEATKAINREARGDSLAITRLDPEREYWNLDGVNGDARDLAEIAYDAMAPLIRRRFARELRDGLEGLDRDDTWATMIRPGDVEDLIARLEAGR